jgi:hypothetical protein
MFLPLSCLFSILPFVVQLPQRRTLAQRVKADENAMSRHLRQPSNGTTGGVSRFSAKEANGVKTTQTRTALGEVTLTAVNRKVRLVAPWRLSWWLTMFF